MPRLRRANPALPGIARVRRGRAFGYLDQSGQPVTDPAVLERIAGLAIPPAWTDVWICPYPNGHIQAIGTDAAGRRQYRYHDIWRLQRDQAKHERVLAFADLLPALRATVLADLQSPGLTRRRVLGCAVRLLDLGFFRIGSEEYAEEHETFGLATLRREHVRVRGELIRFEYPAKGGLHRDQTIADDEVRRVVLSLKRRHGGGPELLAYRTATGWHDVRSAEINEYLRQLTGGDVTAKDFRTWNATVLAAVGLASAAPAARSPSTARRAVALVVKDVARYLGNTPAVCRRSYIDPRVIELYQDGVTIVRDLDELGANGAVGLATQGRVEAAVSALLRGERGRGSAAA